MLRSRFILAAVNDKSTLTVLRASQYPNEMIPDQSNWLNDTNHSALWEYSGRTRTNFWFAMTVSYYCSQVSTGTNSIFLFICLCTEFGLYVDKRGDPSQSIETIEWESTAEHVALHYPYVLIFNSRFIEIRHIETGRLTQIIPGNGIRCIWDGRGLDAYPPAATSVDGFESLDHSCQQSCIHAVMNGPESAATGNNVRPLEAVAQHVFELVPMVP